VFRPRSNREHPSTSLERYRYTDLLEPSFKFSDKNEFLNCSMRAVCPTDAIHLDFTFCKSTYVYTYLTKPTVMKILSTMLPLSLSLFFSRASKYSPQLVAFKHPQSPYSVFPNCTPSSATRF
jgi:hypothetical protein